MGCLEESSLELLGSLPYESETDRQDIKAVLDLLEEINEIYESFNFFGRKQQDSEPFSAYIAELRTLANTCNFGEL